MRASDVATLTVRAGAHSLANSARERGVQDVGVKLVVKHKDFTMQTLVSQLSNQSQNQYKTKYLSLQHSDIAILVLKKPFKFTETVRQICLPSGRNTYEGKKGTVVGWGLLREGGSRPSVLQELTMEIWNNAQCSATYGSTAPAGIKDTMMCAGQKGKDSCSVSYINNIGTIYRLIAQYERLMTHFVDFRVTVVVLLWLLMVKIGNKLVWCPGVLDVEKTSTPGYIPALPT